MNVMIISCSRRTDIPAFYSDWFMSRIADGFVMVRNPVNPKQVRRISLAPADVDCLVFWTKDPAPMLNRLRLLDDYAFYFQFTLTPYDRDIEPHLPPKTKIIETFLKLSDKMGPGRIIWRYDPIFLSDGITVDFHADRFHDLAKQLSGHTEKCVISFLDMYRHLQSRMSDLAVRPPEELQMRELAAMIAQIAGNYKIKVETCAEVIDLADLGVDHGRCVDDRLIAELTGRKLRMTKDKYQRDLCGCVTSIDIGEYNTCGHGCLYCYANVSKKKFEKNQSLHYTQSPSLIGDNSS